MSAAVREGENIWRSAVFPIAFKKNKQLSPITFLKLYAADNSPFVLEMSVVRETYAPVLAMVHGFGCRLASSQNQNLSGKGKNANRVYCGAYQLAVGDVQALKGAANLPEVTKAEVHHIVEAGEFAHANLQIEIDTQGDVDAIEPIKTLIVDRLWQSSVGPSKHICRCDKNVDPHPSELLTVSPKGEYVDARSKFKVALDVALCLAFYYPRLWLVENFARWTS